MNDKTYIEKLLSDPKSLLKESSSFQDLGILETIIHQYVAPSTATEELLAEIWQDLLGQEQVGIHDNFFERGGHSLIATQLVSRIREHFDIEFPLKGVFEFAQLKEMAASLDSSQYDSALPAIVPMPEGQVIPLSFAQQRLWFIDQLMGGESTVYNMPLALRMQGMVNVEALQASFSDLVSRHDSLRMTFVTAKESDHAEQSGEVILLPAFAPLEHKDLSDLSADQQASMVQEQTTAYLDQAFDLQSDPLFKARLLTLSEDEHVLLVNMHHIISDGWSMGVLIQDLRALYQSRIDDTVSTLSPLAIQYQDYAYWQRQWLSGDILEQQLAYWKQQLQGAPELLELPTDRARPAQQSYRGSTFESRISRDTLDKLNQLSQEQGVTLFMTLLAVFNVLLKRYSGQDDICIGSPIANRHQPGTESQVGFFVNTLVLRSQFEGNETFEALLQQVRETCLDAYSHQDVPFEQLVEELQPIRNMAINPLFQVMFVLQNTPDGGLSEEELGALADIELSTLDQEDAGARSLFDLTLSAAETEEGLFLEWEYNTDIFDEWRIEAMSKHFLLLLEELILKPKQNIEYIPLITAEQQQQLISWNDTAVDYPKDQTIIDLFREQARQHPNNTAVVFEETQLSYQELDERSNRLARYLLSQEGIKGEHNPLIAICVERSLEMIVGLLGILKAGGAYVPLDPDYPQERLAYMLGDSGARLLLTQSSLEDQLPEYTDTIVHLDTDWTQIERRSKTSPKVSIGAKDLAYVIYTSGSTGTPKGVMIENQSLLNHMQWMDNRFQFSAQDIFLQKTPFGFDASIWEFYAPLKIGALLVIAPPGQVDTLHSFYSLLTSKNITVLQIVPSLLRHLLNKHALNNTNIHSLFCGGETLPFDVKNKFLKNNQKIKLYNLYGPTEAAIDVTYWNCVPESVQATVPIGHPISNTQIHILDKSQQLVPIGVPGELCIAGAGLARGYLNQPQLTAEKFIYLGIHPETLAFCSDQELENKAKEKEGFVRTRLYRTGDLARWLPDGNIEYLGRTDFQVKIRGFRIELGEIESRLLEHSDIREAVVGVTGEDENKQLVAWIVCHDDGSDVGAEQLRPWLKDTLPEYMVPAFYVPLETLPLTPNGKIDRKALPAPDGELFVHQYVAPSTATEELLAEIWQDLLGQEQVGIHDNFFERGGHSLIATQLVSRIREHFDIEFPLKGVFEFAQLKEMAASLDSSQYDSALPAIVPMPEGQVIPLSFAQQRLWFIDQLMGGESTVYNMPLALRMQGMVNVEALQASFSDLVSRHDSLRMTFVTAKESDHAEQSGEVILLPAFAPLEHKDLSDLSADQQASMVQEQTTAYLDQAFDLQSDPLFKARLLTLSEDEHVLLVNMHHIISDGWSMGVLIQDLRALYQSRIDDTVSTLSPLAIQYQDYAYWQRQWLSGDILEQQLAYWKQQLQGAPELLELPTDRARPAQQSYRGSTFESRISRDTLDKLNQLSQEQGVTLFMTLLAVFNVLLKRYSGQDDICIGSPIANRHQPGTESQVGFFVNTLVLRSQFEGNETFEALLQQVRETCLDAYSHQDVPFEQLVEELQPIRNMAINPLFQVMFVLQNTPDGGLSEEELGALADIELSTLDQEDAGARSLFDLTLSAAETEEGLFLEWEYNTDIFDEWRIEAMSKHFLLLLEELILKPKQNIEYIPLITAEQQQQLISWNDTAVDYPKDQTIIDLFREQARQHPNNTAVVFEETQLSYQELDERSNRLARYLLSQEGIKGEHNPLIAICVERSLEMIVGLLGILKAGGAYVPLDPDYPQERLAYMLGDSGARLLLTQSSLEDQLPEYTDTIVHLDTDWTQIERRSKTSPKVPIRAKDLAYVIYTSGSTGTPKGVMTENQCLMSTFMAWDKLYGLSDTKHNILQMASISFDVFTGDVVRALCSGNKLVICLKEVLLDTKNLYSLICQQSISYADFVPSVLQNLTDYLYKNNHKLDTFRILLAGSDVLPKALYEDIFSLVTKDCRVFNAYGVTEVCIDSTNFLDQT